MVSWLIIAVFVVLLLVFFRVKYMKHKVFAVLFILVLLFLYVTASRVLAGQNINWKSVAGIEKAVKVYFVWLGGAFDNLKVLTGSAVKMDWSIQNKTAEKITQKG